DVIGLQALQRILERCHGDALVAAVGAHLGQQHHAVALALQQAAGDLFAAAVMIFPRIVKKVDPGLERFIDESLAFLLVLNRAEVESAHAQRRNFDTAPAEPAPRYLRVRCCHCQCSRGRRRSHECAAADVAVLCFPHCGGFGVYLGHGLPVFSDEPSISLTSFCCMSSGYSCASRASGLSNFSDILYGSKRPSAACSRTRARRSSISFEDMGVK